MDNSLLDSYSKQLQEYRQQLVRLLTSIVDVHYVHFQQTKIYSKISNLNRTLGYDEQDILEKEIQTHFTDFIRNLLVQCPKITKKEITVSCLALRFPMDTIALCIGYIPTNAVRQHKIRIKKKLTTRIDNSFLFDFIFEGEQKKVTL
jgi:hypothetical protein